MSRSRSGSLNPKVLAGILAAAAAGSIGRGLPASVFNRLSKRKTPYRKALPYSKGKTRSRGTKRRYSRSKTSRYPPKKKKRTSTSRMSKIARQLDANTGTMRYRLRDTSQAVSSDNIQQNTLHAMNDLTDIVMVLGNLYYYDPATPGTLVLASADTGTYARDVHFEQSGMAILVKNNSLGSVHTKIYICTPKVDSDVVPTQDWQNKVNDNPGTTASKTNIGSSPLDLPVQLWNFKLLKTRLLRPGATIGCSHYTGPFSYKPNVSDVQTEEHQRRNKCFQFMVVQFGDLAHDDTTTTNVGRASTTLDIETRKFWRVQYSAGVNLNYTYDNISYDAMGVAPNMAFPSNPTLKAPLV